MAFTFFFRDWDVLDLVTKHVLPELKDCARVRIWDAGCATGEEAYSLAMVLAEELGIFGMRSIEIVATDHEENNNFGTLVTQGIYPASSVSGCPRQEVIEKYVRPVPGSRDIRIVENLRNCISYRRHDLLSLDTVDCGFHMVLCKNVIVHFIPEQREGVLRMFHSALIPGGYLALDRMQELPPSTSTIFTPVVRGENLLRKV
jgi:chemotaxis protein methyltransferase CheR